MPPPDIRSVLTSFRAEVNRCNQLLAAVKAKGIPFFRLQQIAELSYLKVYLGWENFLEESFARFLCGARTISGRRLSCYASPRTIEHARNIVIGLERGGRYADWARRETVATRAELLFKDGIPFALPLQAAARDLDDMRIIRDCI